MTLYNRIYEIIAQVKFFDIVYIYDNLLLFGSHLVKTMENSQLSSHDKDVLTRIFNPSLPYGDTVEAVEETEEVPGSDII